MNHSRNSAFKAVKPRHPAPPSRTATRPLGVQAGLRAAALAYTTTSLAANNPHFGDPWWTRLLRDTLRKSNAVDLKKDLGPTPTRNSIRKSARKPARPRLVVPRNLTSEEESDVPLPKRPRLWVKSKSQYTSVEVCTEPTISRPEFRPPKLPLQPRSNLPYPIVRPVPRLFTIDFEDQDLIERTRAVETHRVHRTQPIEVVEEEEEEESDNDDHDEDESSTGEEGEEESSSSSTSSEEETRIFLRQFIYASDREKDDMSFDEQKTKSSLSYT